METKEMNIYQKLHAIMGSINTLQKDGKVDFKNTRYNYLSEAKTTGILKEKFVEFGIVVLPIGVEETKDGSVTHGLYSYKVVNIDNPDDFIILQSGGQGHDSSDKGSGKASSYAYKYLMWRTFAIPSNDDPDQVASDKNLEEDKKRKAQGKSNPQTPQEATQASVTKDNPLANEFISEDEINALQGEFKRTGIHEPVILKEYGLELLSEMRMGDFHDCVKKFEKYPTKKVKPVED